MLEAQDASQRAGDAEGFARYSLSALPSESATTRRQRAEA